MPIELVKKPFGWKDGPIMTGKYLATVGLFHYLFMTGRHTLGGSIL